MHKVHAERGARQGAPGQAGRDVLCRPSWKEAEDAVEANSLQGDQGEGFL